MFQNALFVTTIFLIIYYLRENNKKKFLKNFMKILQQNHVNLVLTNVKYAIIQQTVNFANKIIIYNKINV